MSGRAEQSDVGAGAEGANAVVSHASLASDPRGTLVCLEGNKVAEMLPNADGGSATPTPLSVALRRKWLILGIFVLTSATMVPFIWLFISPKYEAKGLIRVSPIVDVIAFNTPENTGTTPLYGMFLNTQVSIVKSATVLERVLDRESILQTSWCQEKVRPLFGKPPTVLERLKESLEVEPIRNTELIGVSMTALEPRSAAVIVNAVIEEYQKHSDEILQQVNVDRLNHLQRELTRVQNEIRRLREYMHNEAMSLGTDDPQDLRALLSARLDTLESDYAESKRALLMTKWELELLTPAEDPGQDAGEGEDGEVEAQRRYASDDEWRGLSVGLKDVEHQLELARQQYGEAHPRIQALLLDLKHAKEQLQDRKSQLDEQWAQGGYGDVALAEGSSPEMRRASLETDAQRQGRQVELLQRDIENVKARILEAADVTKKLADYEEEITRKRELYGRFQARLTALEMEGKAAGRISVESLATVPTQPTRDRRLKLTAVCLGGAMMLGWAVAYVRTSTDQRIREAGDVRGSVHVPFLGQLPSLSADMDLLADCNPLLVETTRMVRTALLRRLSGTSKQVVLITSSSSQSGKTSVAILLAKSLALLGKKVLLVEADLRRPSLSGRLNLESKSGLAASLTGAARDDQAILPTGVAGFDALMAGEYPPGFDAELLANGVLASCLKRWKSRYDFVLLDSPPVLPVADARILAGQADGTIMVLRASHSRRPEVVQAYADLSAAGGTLLGTVLVGVRGGSGPGNYYGDYEPYGREPRALTS